jgi:methyltransferase family protein
MSEVATETLPPHAQLVQMGMAHMVSRVLYTAADLGVADHLAPGPKSAAELAGATGTHAPSLHRLMRTLAHLGLLTEGAGQRFALTPLGEALRTGAPGAARATILTVASAAFGRAFDELKYSVQTGKTSFDHVFGEPFFAGLRRTRRSRRASARR